MRRGLTMLVLLSLSSCGINLSIVRQDLRVKLPDGTSHRVRIEARPEHGFLQPNFDDSVVCWLAQTVFGVLLEPVDLIASTTAAVNAMFDQNHDIAGGPIGWLAAMTPFATLVPPVHLSYIIGRRIDEAQWQKLSSDNAADRRSAARQVWPLRNTTYVHPVAADVTETATTDSHDR